MTATGLRRFIKPEPLPHRAVGMPAVRSDERCEMCALRLAETHNHLVDLTSRALMCCCRACYFLFEPEGAGGGRYRPVPERYLHDPDFRLSLAQWEELAIPVGMIFVFAQTGQNHPVAFYPSPAGATESLLPLEAWARVMQANPAFGDVRPDVEAVLLRRDGERFDGYLVPIDACYHLVGRVRLRWKGFSGGEEVWQELASFFDGLAQRAQDSDSVCANG